MKEFCVRPLRTDEISLLEEFIYQSIFQRPGEKVLPRSIIKAPEIAVYIQDYGKPDDNCLVAEWDDQVVGAVWTRILSGEVKGFGNVADDIPEFAISILPEYRGRGIGRELMEAMLELLKEEGYPRASLAVQKDNYALRLYEKVGFHTVGETEEEYIMTVDLI